MSSQGEHERAGFRTTSWSLVAAAAAPHRRVDGQADEEIQDALQQLCRAYWYPVYSFIRRCGSKREEAEDMTQGFFAQLLEKDYLADADRSRGRFRTFLLAAVKHFVANQRDRDGAVKRGGRVKQISLDFDQAEARYAIEPIDGWTADAIYDRSWALSLLREVLSSIEEDYRASGKDELFQALSPHLTGSRDGETLAQVAEKLQSSAGAVKVAAHRLRSTYRQRLVQAVAATLENEDDVDAERKLLLRAMTGTAK